jgi:hypothetical protein
MNIFHLLGVSLLSFILFEIWQFYSNYNNIINFNKTYYNIQYGIGAFVNIDPNTNDPNDFITNIQQKFRCVSDNDNKYYTFSINGYYSNDAFSRTLNFNTLNSCINYTFGNSIKTIYNACLLNPFGSDCIFVQNNI